tara:strand:+ start:7645 stop:8565 length:921 start_codon:yes stop_codon:yes gene_type:complete
VAAVALLVCTVFSTLSMVAEAQGVLSDGVYTNKQAQQGQALYTAQCAVCHGQSLTGGLGPPLSGETFVNRWSSVPLSDLAGKIRNTMPEDAPGELTTTETVRLVSYVLQTNGFPEGSAGLSEDLVILSQISWPAGLSEPEPSGLLTASSVPPVGNLAEVMRGILFPSSNLLFNAQIQDPGLPHETFDATNNFSWVEWGAGIYSGWQIVDYAAIALAEASPLFLTPGRLCENGQPVPVEQEDWIQYTADMIEAGKAAYRAAQTRDQATVSEVTNVIADACYNCHEAYRDKPGGTVEDPSNKAARCIP